MTSERRRGFTLLEMALVLAVVGLAAGILVPRLGDVAAFELDATAHRLADTLTLARERAALRATPAHVALDLGAGSWSTDETSARTTLPARVRLHSVTANGGPAVYAGTAVIRFDPAGDALPARVELARDGGGAVSVVLPPGRRAVVVR